MTFKPMLSGKAELDKLTYPLLASPKLDGIRCIVRNCEVLSRSLKPIPNMYVQSLFGHPELEGFDGELIVGSPTDDQCYLNTNSGVMSVQGEPDVMLYAFDHVTYPSEPFIERYKRLNGSGHRRVEVLVQRYVRHLDEMLEMEEMFLSQGYEGIMLRKPDAAYKMGRSTTKEGILLKLKRFEDSEAEVLGIVEMMHNQNEAKRDALGHIERSTCKEGLVPAGMMGTIQVRDIHTQVEFEIGTGFTLEDRIDIFANPDKYIGQRLAKYQHFPIGAKDKPRLPSFKGWRSREDL